MASEKTLNTRFQNKHDIEANWNKATNFIPKVGEMIVYDKDSNFNYPRIKIGDGSANVINLPFINTDYYTKSEIDAYNFITVDDIDTICGNTIQIASEVKY